MASPGNPGADTAGLRDPNPGVATPKVEPVEPAVGDSGSAEQATATPGNLPKGSPPEAAPEQAEKSGATATRPFQCTHQGCKKTFASNGHLTRHMKVHLGTRPYACPISGCTSRFSRNDNMLQHYRNHQKKIRLLRGLDYPRARAGAPPPAESGESDAPPATLAYGDVSRRALVASAAAPAGYPGTLSPLGVPPVVARRPSGGAVAHPGPVVLHPGGPQYVPSSAAPAAYATFPGRLLGAAPPQPAAFTLPPPPLHHGMWGPAAASQTGGAATPAQPFHHAPHLASNPSGALGPIYFTAPPPAPSALGMHAPLAGLAYYREAPQPAVVPATASAYYTSDPAAYVASPVGYLAPAGARVPTTAPASYPLLPVASASISHPMQLVYAGAPPTRGPDASPHPNE